MIKHLAQHQKIKHFYVQLKIYILIYQHRMSPLLNKINTVKNVIKNMTNSCLFKAKVNHILSSTFKNQTKSLSTNKIAKYLEDTELVSFILKNRARVINCHVPVQGKTKSYQCPWHVPLLFVSIHCCPNEQLFPPTCITSIIVYLRNTTIFYLCNDPIYLSKYLPRQYIEIICYLKLVI